MNLKEFLEAEHSQKQMLEIVKEIGSNQKKFDTLVQLFLLGEYKISQRASWPLSNCIALHPRLINKHYKELIRHMKDDKQHPAVRRNVLRAFDLIKNIPEAYHGELMDACFAYISNPNETIASQAFSLGVLHKLSRLYPEIKNELLVILENNMLNASAGFKSRALKILKENSRNSI